MPTRGSCNYPFGPPHRRLPPSLMHHCANYASTIMPLCYLHSHRKIQLSQTDSLLPPSDGDEMVFFFFAFQFLPEHRPPTILRHSARSCALLSASIQLSFMFPSSFSTVLFHVFEAPFRVSLRCFILEPSCFKAGSSLLTKAELPGFFCVPWSGE